MVDYIGGSGVSFDVLLIGLDSHALYKTMSQVEVAFWAFVVNEKFEATEVQVTKLRGTKVRVTIERGSVNN